MTVHHLRLKFLVGWFIMVSQQQIHNLSVGTYSRMVDFKANNNNHWKQAPAEISISLSLFIGILTSALHLTSEIICADLGSLNLKSKCKKLSVYVCLPTAKWSIVVKNGFFQRSALRNLGLFEQCSSVKSPGITGVCEKAFKEKLVISKTVVTRNNKSTLGLLYI